MSFPKQFLDEIRSRVALSDVVGKTVKLTRAGREHKGCCPFHKEKTPSFTLNDQKGFFHCFGCGAHGDIIGFVMQHDNLGFPEAVQHLAGLAGLHVPQPTEAEAKAWKQQKSLTELLEQATLWFTEQLYKQNNKKALEYLLKRGLKEEIIRSFRLGYAPVDDGGALQKALEQRGYTAKDMIEVGLLRPSTREKGGYYSFFRGRAIFPVMDSQGRVVAFGGRTLPEVAGGVKENSQDPPPKYINSSESSVFHKGRILYGLHKARIPAGKGEPIVVVEGYMDVIAMHQAGVDTAVAPMGTALTETQIFEIWKAMGTGQRAPILCFDGDNAGQRAAGRSLERILPILRPDHSACFAFLPAGHDPDTLIRTGGVSAIRKVLDGAISLMDMLWLEELKGRSLDQPEARAGFKASLEKRISTILDIDINRFFMDEAGRRIDEAFFSHKSSRRQAGQGLGKPGYGANKGRFQPKPQDIARQAHRPMTTLVAPTKKNDSIREKILLAAMINHPGLFEEFGEKLGMLETGSPELDLLRQEVVIALSGENPFDIEGLRHYLSSRGFDKLLGGLFDKSLYLHAGFAKPDQPIELVRQGWSDTWERGLSTKQRA